MVGRGKTMPAGQIPFTPRAKKVLELSLLEARELGDQHIGTEHLLLGLVREGEGVAVQVLRTLGVDADDVRRTVITILSGDPERPPDRSSFVRCSPMSSSRISNGRSTTTRLSSSATGKLPARPPRVASRASVRFAPAGWTRDPRPHPVGRDGSERRRTGRGALVRSVER
jgi:ATPases with chaperone activity, ATP-binding subunit